MSAVGAIVDWRGAPIDRRALERMREALRLYGPDRSGIAEAEAVGLVWTHRAGFTPQDKAERQPIAVGCGFLCFVGRLDHREALANALGLSSAQLDWIPDGTLAAHAWDRWGARAVEHLRGDYSILSWDVSERRLIVARAPYRAPPIHYHVAAGRLAVASMPKGLFALDHISRCLDEQHLADALVHNLQDLSATYFKDIASLPLGHMLVADQSGVKVLRFYSLRDAPSVRFPQQSDYIDAANAVLATSVASAMRSISMPGISLSSGLDSTAVAVAALEHCQANEGPALLGLVSVPDPEWDGRVHGYRTMGDESPPVLELAKHYPALDVCLVDSAGVALDHRLDQLMMAADMPIGPGNVHWGIEIDRVARERGRRVLLTGGSGNATLSFSAGAAVRAEWLRSGHWATLATDLRLANARAGNRRWLGFSGLGGAVLPLLPVQLFAAFVRWRRTDYGGNWRDFSAINPDFAARMHVSERMADLGWDDWRQPIASRQDSMIRTFERGGRHQAGTRVAAFEAVTGVNRRDPLGDRALAEFCYGIPDDCFYRDGIDRRLVRDMMADRLPSAILSAPRGVQSADWHLRLKRDAARFSAELETFGADPAIADRIDLVRVRRVLRDLPAGTPMSRKEYPDLSFAMNGIGRAIAVARFIRAIEGRNG